MAYAVRVEPLQRRHGDAPPQVAPRVRLELPCTIFDFVPLLDQSQRFTGRWSCEFLASSTLRRSEVPSSRASLAPFAAWEQLPLSHALEPLEPNCQ